MNPWQLPDRAVIGGKEYTIHGDFRDILEIFSYLTDPEQPEFLRWRIALALFYEEPVPESDRQAAAEYLCRFINGGKEETGPSGPRLLDWEQDGLLIVADVNTVAGQEIRAMPFVHWWTFLAWFHGVGQGQLAAVVSLRDKLCRGKPLEDWEKEFYRDNKQLVDLKPRYTPQQLKERQQLEQLLSGKEEKERSE